MFLKLVTNVFDSNGFRSSFIENVHGFENLVEKIQSQNPFATPDWIAELEHTINIKPGEHSNVIEFKNGRDWTLAVTVIRIC